ncbi:MAG: sulfur carrier protein ThiS adenylyltransferase ThiF [Candidatus Cloacimonetes bacterium]|nr:sulfur carrier protein ThiS adenylyltransferase ThiF [Candidatus Cloacimonadota bacterium]MCF7814091.1 sulfur carrier protein ThiS adenylyltransferase ThiF [Candidatus Cloacimonadota bacterium]MCF7867980.1 sulfur carrier protein ThiS adenylyltransferase ThiF [Candidatus Cloacimonadota bacterium]MCF7883438.1 sulfur carrier protein ThiS adenylyltransferase ThiF [Candidatus Cloacimonadota bacterium]
MKKSDFFANHDPRIIPILQNSIVGIAGCGGLGSNAAFTLTRVGIGKLIFADFDKIEPSNLNRQQFFIDQIGYYKADALKANLSKISTFTEFEAYNIKLTEANIPEIFKDADIMVEAFDKAEMKEMLIDCWLEHFPQKPIIAASGLAGWGRNELLKTRKLENLYICGDEQTELQSGISPMAPRVGIVANMQVNLVLEILLKDL